MHTHKHTLFLLPLFVVDKSFEKKKNINKGGEAPVQPKYELVAFRRVKN